MLLLLLFLWLGSYTQTVRHFGLYTLHSLGRLLSLYLSRYGLRRIQYLKSLRAPCSRRHRRPSKPLYRTCARFTEDSRLLRKLFRREDIRIGTYESLDLCSAEQLKSGYLKGCHLCALIWDRAGGHLFDPSKSIISESRIILQAKATNSSKEYEMEREEHVVQRWWWKLAPLIVYGNEW